MPRPIIDEALVQRLLAEQFPIWASLAVQRVSPGGWDNRTFRLGEDLLARLPSAERYAAQVEREQRCLPQLAAVLPTAIPIPMARGRPGRGYPFDWSIYKWIDGDPLATAELWRSTELACQLAGFLRALQSCPADAGPPPGVENFHRGGSLAAYDDEMRSALARLNLDLQSPLRQVWRDALSSEWSERAVWVHGDFAPRNLLVRGDLLVGVIDFGQVAVGDPACDLAITWTYLRGPARSAFRDNVGADAATWARARGWAAWKAAILLSGVAHGPKPDTDAATVTIQSLLQDP